MLRNDFDRVSVTSIWAESAGARAGRHETQILACPSPFEVVVPHVAGISMNPGDWGVIYDDHNAPGPAVRDSASDCLTSRILSVSEHPDWPELSIVEFFELPVWVDPGDYFTDGLIPEANEPGLIFDGFQQHCSCHIGVIRDKRLPCWGAEFPFRLLPQGIGVTKLSTGNFPLFDTTRQRRVRAFATIDGVRQPAEDNGDWLVGDEKPNDDFPSNIPGLPNIKNEDVTPVSPYDRIVSYDAPGVFAKPSAVPAYTRAEIRANFLEFCRVGLDGNRPQYDNLQGSRCSGKTKWNVIFDVVPQDANFWRKATAADGPNFRGNEIVIGIHLVDAILLEIHP